MEQISNSASSMTPPPEPVHAGDPGTAASRWARLGRHVRQLGRDSVYLVVGFPLAIASFSVLVTGVATSIGLIPLALVGIPLGIVVMYVAQGFGAAQRSLVRFDGERIEPPRYRPVDPNASWVRRLLAIFRDPQRWLNIAHGLVIFPLATATFIVATVWWATMLGGLTYWFWEPLFLDEPGPEENRTIAEALNWDVSPILFQFLGGVVALLTIIPVLRGCAIVHNWLAKALLSNAYIRSLQDRVDTLTAGRTAIAEAEVQSLRQLERDLHDGPQQRLVRLGMDLAAAERRLETDPEESRRLVAEARSMTADALDELRQLSRGIAPPVLTDRGLPAAVDALGARSTIPVRADVQVERRPAVAVEAAAYFVISEALANAAKHSGADLVTVEVHDSDDWLEVEVTDTGRGGASLAKGHGLAGLAERVEGLDGTFQVSSPTGGPTTIRARLPR